MLFLLLSIAIPNAIKVSADSTSTAITYTFSKSSINKGDKFDIYVKVSDVSDLYGASIDLKLDPKIIKVDGIDKGDFWTSDGATVSSGNPFFNDTTGDYSCYAMLTGNRAGLKCTSPSTLFVIHAIAADTGSTVLKTISDNSDLSFTGNNVKVKLSNTNDGLVVTQKIPYSVNDTAISIKNSIVSLTPGVYQETNNNFIYNGAWTNQNATEYNGGTAKISNTNGNTVSFSFIGTGFKWIGLSGPSVGIAKVTVDGVDSTVNGYSSSSTFKKVLFQCSGLNLGTHTVTITVTNSKDPKASNYYQAIDSIEVVEGKPDLTAGVYNENNSALTYTGSWAVQSSPSYTDGAAKISNVNGDSINFSFIGTGFKWIGLSGPSVGIAKVTVDGVDSTVNGYSSSSTFKKVLFQCSGLNLGTHTVTITVTNSKDPKAGNYYQSIDSLEIIE